MIAGASVRYRLYSAWGLSTLQITQVVAFCTLSWWLGFFTLGGAVFLIEPLTIPAAIHLPLASLRPIGMVMLAAVLTYGIVTAAKKTAITIREWEIQLPSVRLFVFQLIIAASTRCRLSSDYRIVDHRHRSLPDQRIRLRRGRCTAFNSGCDLADTPAFLSQCILVQPAV